MKFPLIFIIGFLLFINCGKKAGQESGQVDKTERPESSITQLPADLQKLIGVEFGPDSMPPGYTEETGYVMGYLEGDEYIIDHVSKANLQMLWFCKLTSRDTEGRPYLRILDILLLPRIEKNEELLMGTCKFNDEMDPEIVAIVKFSESEVKSEVVQAWRASRNSKKFESIPTASITCVNESFYL
ncbi:MAG: hypothetical protein P8Y60_00950 [Calditrichota bacterium]|jgi:hypothetical protein